MNVSATRERSDRETAEQGAALRVVTAHQSDRWGPQTPQEDAMGTVDPSGNSDARREIDAPSKLQDQSSAGTVRETVYRHRRKLLLDPGAQAPPPLL